MLRRLDSTSPKFLNQEKTLARRSRRAPLLPGGLLLALLWCVLGAQAKLAHAQAGRYVADGMVAFDLDTARGLITSVEEDISNTTLRRVAEAIVLTTSDGRELARAERGSDKAISILDNGVTLFKVRFEYKDGEEQYRIFGNDQQLAYRVKLKSDKFNVYDSTAKRIFHGKRKPEGWSVNSDDGAKVILLKGPANLREASFFAVPLSTRYRMVLWGAEYLK